MKKNFCRRSMHSFEERPNERYNVERMKRCNYESCNVIIIFIARTLASMSSTQSKFDAPLSFLCTSWWHVDTWKRDMQGSYL